jgi:hypothetical protein
LKLLKPAVLLLLSKYQIYNVADDSIYTPQHHGGCLQGNLPIREIMTKDFGMLKHETHINEILQYTFQAELSWFKQVAL